MHAPPVVACEHLSLTPIDQHLQPHLRNQRAPVRYRCPRGTARRSLLTLSAQRPRRRRRLSTARPSFVFIRDRKPCFRRRGIRFGCQVRFGIISHPSNQYILSQLYRGHVLLSTQPNKRVLNA
jgi:hypothetical protein